MFCIDNYIIKDWPESEKRIGFVISKKYMFEYLDFVYSVCGL